MKPKSRGTVSLRSANPDDMPLVSPNLLKDPDDMRTMIEGQNIPQAIHTDPLRSRFRKIAISDPADVGDEALRAHCKRFVKTTRIQAAPAGRRGRPVTPWLFSIHACG